LLLTLAWHGLVFGVLSWWAPWEDVIVEPRHYDPIEMVFATPQSDQDSSAPREFTELPEDRADLTPQDPDYISNLDSRARDRAVDGEETDLPELRGDSEAPHVGMSPDVQTPPQQNDEGSGNEDAVTADGERDEEDHPSNEGAEAGTTQLREDQPRPPSDGRRGQPGAGPDISGTPFPTVEPLPHKVGPALSDLRQEEMHNPFGDVPLFGDVSMNTVAWPWAAWLQQFQRNFLRGWINFVPYAYRIGVIHGKQVIRLEIDPDGTLLGIEVLEREGHASLEEASLANLKSFTPYGPLSEDGSFPEPTLQLQLTIIYPDF